jgi:hypothetical protein
MCAARSIILLLMTSAALVGCASKRAPLPAPLATVDRSIYSGTVLSGPTTRPVAAHAPTDILIVSVELVALDDVPAILNPVAPDVRLIITTAGTSALQPRSQLTHGVRWQVSGDMPPLKGPSTSFASDNIALPRGASALVKVADQSNAASEFRISLGRSNTAGELELAVTLSGQIKDDEGSDKPAETWADETAVLKPIKITEPTTASLLIPFTFTKSRVRSVLARIEIRPATNRPEDAALITASSQQINRSIAMASTTQPSTAPERWPGYDVAMRGLTDPGARRASLLFICRQVHANICRDFALTASDPALEALAGTISNAATSSKIPSDDASAAWLLDGSALRYAADLQAKEQLPPELVAVLIRHTGQAAMNSGSVAEILGKVKTREEFEARVVSENLIYLEDTSPAARSRACEWLAQRGKAPPGYEPLAPLREREAALEKVYDSMSQQASRNGGRP